MWGFTQDIRGIPFVLSSFEGFVENLKKGHFGTFWGQKGEKSMPNVYPLLMWVNKWGNKLKKC